MDEDNNAEPLRPLMTYPTNLVDYILINDEIINCGDKYDLGVLEKHDSIDIIFSKDEIKTNYLLTFTTLPTLIIKSSKAILDEPKNLSKFWFNNFEGFSYKNLIGGVEYRGASSQAYEKKSYDIEFWKDSVGLNNQDYTFSYMRNDDDWILDAMYIDLSRIRNLAGMTICSLITNGNNVYLNEGQKLFQSGEFIELNVNNSYLGVFSFNEQIDRKQLGLSSQATIYKADYYTDETLMTGITSLPSISKQWNGYELKYPKSENIQHWDKIYNLISEVVFSNDSLFASNIVTMVDINNLIDFWIVINISQAIDNMSKNIFIFCNSDNEPLLFSPMDLDLTFGNQNFYVSFPIDKILSNSLIDRLITLNVRNFNELLKNRWSEFNIEELHDEVLEFCSKKINQLINSQAHLREQEKWLINLNLDDELEYISSWLTARLNILDQYIISNF